MNWKILKKKLSFTREQNAIFYLVLFTIFFISGLWTIDVGASAVANGMEIGTMFFIRDGLFQYHLGLVLTLASYIGVVCILIKTWKWAK